MKTITSSIASLHIAGRLMWGIAQTVIPHVRDFLHLFFIRRITIN